MKALVTGGGGFIGSHVVDALLDKGLDVVAVDDLSGGSRDNVNDRALFIEGSILDRDLVSALFDNHKFEFVFHLAAYAAEGLSHFIRHFNYDNNLIGSVDLINASVLHEVRCFVFTSSIAVYGKNQLPMTEDLQPSPEDPYGIAKYAVELDLRSAHSMFGLNYLIFRPHNVYGERQNIGDKYRNVIGIFMNQIIDSQPMTIFGDGEQTRAFSYIGDVAPVMVEGAMRPEVYNQTYNVGSDVAVKVKELARMVSDAFGTETRLTFLKERLEVRHAYASHEKLKRDLGYRCKTPLKEGIGRMARWAATCGSRKSKEFADIEIRKSLPSSWR